MTWYDFWEAIYEVRWLFYGYGIAMIIIILCGINGSKKKKKCREELERRKSLPYDPNDRSLDHSLADGIYNLYFDWFEYEGEKYASGTIVRLFPELRIKQGLEERMKYFDCREERAVKFINRTHENMYNLRLVKKDENGNWVECSCWRNNSKCLYFTHLVPEHFIQEIIIPKELTRHQKIWNKNGRSKSLFEELHIFPPVFTPLIIGGALCLIGGLFNAFVPVASVVVAILELYFICAFASR